MGSRRQDYVARLRALDRSARHDRRRAKILEARTRRRRLARLVVAGLVVLAFATSGAIGSGLAGTIGALYGLAAAGLLLAIALVVRLVARRRGASAWNWQTQGFSVIGDPSKHVHDADRRDRRSDDLLPRPERR